MGDMKCIWLIAVDIGPDGHPDTMECGADVHDVTDGWECDAGHRHYTYGSTTQQAIEHQEALIERSGQPEHVIDDAIERLHQRGTP